jgi:2'-5' RNA ligase
LPEIWKQFDEDDLFTKEADNGIEKDSHVTVKYGLLTNDVKDIKECLKDAVGGKVHLGTSSIFECEEYDVVKISVTSKALEKIHNQLNSLPHNDKYMDYKAHSTLAYVKSGCGKKYDGKFKINKDFDISEVYFGDLDKKDHKIKLK